METDQRYLQHDSGSNRDDGCTAVAAVLVENQLLVANVGDSRAVLSRNGKGMSCCYSLSRGVLFNYGRGVCSMDIHSAGLSALSVNHILFCQPGLID